MLHTVTFGLQEINPFEVRQIAADGGKHFAGGVHSQKESQWHEESFLEVSLGVNRDINNATRAGQRDRAQLI